MATPIEYLMVDDVPREIRDANAVPQTRTINRKMLNQDIFLTLSDLGVTIMTNEEIDDMIDS